MTTGYLIHLTAFGERIPYIVECDIDMGEPASRECPETPANCDIVRLKREQPGAPWIDGGELTPDEWDRIEEAVWAKIEAQHEAHLDNHIERMMYGEAI